MKKFKNLKAILFDFGGTIDGDGLPWKELFQEIYIKAGINCSQEKYDRAFYDADDYLTDLGLKKVGYQTMLNRQVSLVLKNLGVQNPKIKKQVTQEFMRLSFASFKQKLPLIKQWSKQYKLGIVSNFYGNLPHLLKEVKLDQYFGAIIDSRWQGCIKPDPKIFNAALKRLGVNAQETLFVGDSLKRDMAGAKNLNMPHVWINVDCKLDKNRCCKNDIVIRKLTDLENYL